MGTKVQCKSYIPGYNPMMGHDDERNGSWSMFYDGSRAPNGNLYNAFMLKTMNGYSEYDKEMLKRTMLEHEAIFRKQVYELHRLYRIQKNLMDDLKKKELYRYSVQLDTSCSSQANSFSSQIQLENTKKMLHMAHLPVESGSYSRAPTTGTDNLRLPLNFLKDNQNGVQSSRSSVDNGCSRKDDALTESNSNRSSRRMFDLQLPADVYIDDEETERSEKENVVRSSVRAMDFLNKSHSKEPVNEVMLTLGTSAHSVCREDNHRLDAHLRNGLTARSFTDLNEPIKGSSSEVAACSPSPYLFGPKTHHVDFLDSKLPLRANSNSFVFQKESDRHKDVGNSSNLICADMVEIRKELPLFRNDSGQSHGHVNPFGPGAYSEKIEVKLNRTHGIKESDLNKMDTWFRQKPSDNTEVSGTNSCLAGFNKSRIADPRGLDILSGVPSDVPGTLSPLDSSWRKPMNSISHIPFTIQAHPHFNIATMNLENGISNIQNKSFETGVRQNSPLDLNPISCFTSASFISEKPKLSSSSNCNNATFRTVEGQTPQKSFKGLCCSDVKSGKDLNLNEAFSSGIQDDLVADRDSLALDMQSKHGESSVGFSWLKRKPSFDGTTGRNNSKMESMQSYSQLLSSFSAAASELERKPDKDKACFLSGLRELPSTLDVEESRLQRNEASDSLSTKRILGFPILGKGDKTTTCSPSAIHQLHSFTDDMKCNKRAVLHCLENQSVVCGQKGSGSNNLSSRNHINLNFLACVESPKSAELPSALPVPAPKLALEIDLEALPTCQPEDDPMFLGESLEAKHHPLPVLCSKETENLHEKCVREAAESIIAMSMDACGNADEGTFRESSPTGSDALYLLAEVVSSNSEKELKEGRCRRADTLDGDDDGLDLFELMTLNLKEMKVDEYWCQPQEPVNQQEDGKGAAALLLTGSRRDQARKRRQRRDFQKDILPGLASLARHEVTEDLQVIGGLIRASGKSWQTGLTRRNSGRNMTQIQAKGRQRPRRLPVTVPEIDVNHQAVKPVTTEFEVDTKAIVGWGRTTRRCRRSRCPLGNVSTPLT